MTPMGSGLRRPNPRGVRRVLYVLLPLLIPILAIAGIAFTLTHRQSLTPPNALSSSLPTSPTAATTSVIVSKANKIDEHLTIDETLREVNFCGTTYRAKQVFIDGVDVVQRIAQLVTTGQLIRESDKENLSESICSNFAANVQFETRYYTPITKQIEPEVTSYSNYLGHKTYDVYIVAYGFQIDTITHDIYVDSAIGGAPDLTIDKLK